MRTFLRVLALGLLAAALADAVAISHRNGVLVYAAAAVLLAAAVWRDAVVLPAALTAGGLYLVALLLGHVPYDPGALLVGAALLLWVDLSAWSAATPAHAAIPAAALLRLVVAETIALTIGAGVAAMVILGRSQAASASMVPWVAGLVTLSAALLVPALRRGGGPAGDER